MNFELSEDEEMLKALVERFVGDHYSMEQRRAALAYPHGFSPANWSLLGDLGLIAACFPQDAGGLGLDATGIATVFEAIGRGLVVEPLIENVLLAGRLFAAGAKPELAEAWLPALSSGERRIAFAHAEPGGRPGRSWVETAAVATPGGARLSGTKDCVPAGAGADGYIVSARDPGGDPADPHGIDLYFVPADAPGLTATPWRMADGSVAVSLRLTDVESPHGLSGGMAAIEQAGQLANLARCAEAIGIMERMFAETADYLRTREQFGVRLASFQAIQHRMVAQYVALETARGLLNLAIVSAGGADFGQAGCGARAFIAPASVTLGHEMMQFHGGMGVSDELSIGHAHKRLLVLSRWPDDPDSALDAYAGAG